MKKKHLKSREDFSLQVGGTSWYCYFSYLQKVKKARKVKTGFFLMRAVNKLRTVTDTVNGEGNPYYPY